MKIAVIGTRGFPDIEGGIETHCRELYTRLSELGVSIVVYRRKRYLKSNRNQPHFNNIEFVDGNSLPFIHLENISHSLISIFSARKNHADIVHLHGIGPGLLSPFVRLLGMRCVLTHHGPDYNRTKWGAFAKVMLRLGEKIGCQYSDVVITISNEIKKSLPSKYNCKAFLIPNGVQKPVVHPPGKTLLQWNLEPQKYILTACRFVPEKRLEDIIEAYKMLLSNQHKLVIAGRLDQNSTYVQKIRRAADSVPGVILTDSLDRPALEELYSHARLFILASSHEGLPIALLEAMSYNIPVIVSNIPAMLEMNLQKKDYFHLGDVRDLSRRIDQELSSSALPSSDSKYKERVLIEYDWDVIAGDILEIYSSLMKIRKIRNRS